MKLFNKLSLYKYIKFKFKKCVKGTPIKKDTETYHKGFDLCKQGIKITTKFP